MEPKSKETKIIDSDLRVVIVGADLLDREYRRGLNFGYIVGFLVCFALTLWIKGIE